jgi:hypothetical protein
LADASVEGREEAGRSAADNGEIDNRGMGGHRWIVGDVLRGTMQLVDGCQLLVDGEGGGWVRFALFHSGLQPKRSRS